MGIRLDLEERFEPEFDFDQLARFIQACYRNTPERSCLLTLPSTNRSFSDIPPPLEEASLSTCPGVIIKYGEFGVQAAVGSDLLTRFWRDHFGSECEICHKYFSNIDPTIRTVSLEKTSPFVIRVHNRHLACIRRSQVPFIPMSHVWDPSIARANVSRETELQAVDRLREVLTVTLPAVTASFCLNYGRVELWHDYVSIPQWQRSVQQALLLMLPGIFAAAPLCLINIDDVTGECILKAVDSCRESVEQSRKTGYPNTVSKRSYSAHLARCLSRGDESGIEDAEDSNSECSVDDRLEAEFRGAYGVLAQFFGSRWFRRMWVSLEFAYCRKACIYTADHTILWDNSPDGLDSFSQIFDGLQQGLRDCIHKAGLGAFEKVFEMVPVPLLGPLGDMRKSVRRKFETGSCDALNSGIELSFAEVLAFVAGRDAACYRDRFIAMASFLHIGDYATTLKEMPPRADDACLWLALRCIERGDYSPLLMLERGEQRIPRARWLVGHQAMMWYMWDLGPRKSRFINHGVSVEENLIRLRLNPVGVIEKRWAVQFEETHELRDFAFVLDKILSHNDGHSDMEVLNALDRIYGVPKFIRPDSLPAKLSASYVVSWEQGKVEFSRLLLSCRTLPAGSFERQTAIIRLVSRFRLQERLRGTANGWTRLSYACNPLHRAAGYEDCLMTVRCPKCAGSFFYRLTLKKDSGERIHVYRIPGLEYRSSLPDGVGLVVCEGEIIGRMIYGTPACNCKISKYFDVR